MRDEDVRHPPSADRLQGCGEMGRIVGTGVDQGEIARANDVGVGALKGEGARIVGDDAHHAGRQFARLAVGELHGGLEG
jgi:hypothetical protein